MSSFYLTLAGLCLITLTCALVYSRKHPVKREFATGFFFTLVTFFVAVDPGQRDRLVWMLIALTGYHLYLFVKH
jgi:Ca2+/Na+ antiporter